MQNISGISNLQEFWSPSYSPTVSNVVMTEQNYFESQTINENPYKNLRTLPTWFSTPPNSIEDQNAYNKGINPSRHERPVIVENSLKKRKLTSSESAYITAKKVSVLNQYSDKHRGALNLSLLPLKVSRAEQINPHLIELFTRDRKKTILNDLTKIILIKKYKNDPLKVAFLDFEIIINCPIEHFENQNSVSIIDPNGNKISLKNIHKKKLSDHSFSLFIKCNEVIFSSTYKLTEFIGWQILGNELKKLGSTPTALEYNNIFTNNARIVELNICDLTGNKTYYIPVYLFPSKSRPIRKIIENTDQKKEFISNISNFEITNNLESALASMHKKMPAKENLINFGFLNNKEKSVQPEITLNEDFDLNLLKAEIFPISIRLKKLNDIFQNIIISNSEDNSLYFNDFRIEITFPERTGPINVAHLKAAVSIAAPQREEKILCNKVDIDYKINKLLLSVSPGIFSFTNKSEMEAISGGKLGYDDGFPMYGSNHPIHKSINSLNTDEYAILLKKLERIVEVTLFISENKYTFSLPCYLLSDQSFDCSEPIGQILKNPISTMHFLTILFELKKNHNKRIENNSARVPL